MAALVANVGRGCCFCRCGCSGKTGGGGGVGDGGRGAAERRVEGHGAFSSFPVSEEDRFVRLETRSSKGRWFNSVLMPVVRFPTKSEDMENIGPFQRPPGYYVSGIGHLFLSRKEAEKRPRLSVYCCKDGRQLIALALPPYPRALRMTWHGFHATSFTIYFCIRLPATS